MANRSEHPHRPDSKTIYETGRAATVNLPQGWNWLNTPIAAQAETLRLLVDRKASAATLDRLISALLSLRRDGTWGNSYNNAQALSALTTYSQRLSTPPNFTATAKLNGKMLLSNQFQGYKNPSRESTISMADLPKGRHNLQIEKAGKGTLHYMTTYRYRPQNPPGRFNGLRVTRSIHSASQKTAIATMGLQMLEKPLTVKPGQVFEIALEMVTDHPIDHLVINDPLPAGFEAIDSSFQTATSATQSKSDSWQISYQTIYRDRVTAYGDHLEAGIYTMHYLVRSVTPGTFLYPGADIHLQYAPEEFGRSACTTVQISP